MASSSYISQAAISFVVLLVGYVSYSSVAVPLIEGAPAAEEVTPTPRVPETNEPPSARFQGLIDPLFPEGSWERHNAKILKTDRLLVLLKDYNPVPDNRLHISPCTIVLLPDPQTADTQRTWIIQAIEGAILEFDKGVEIGRGEFGKIVSAYVPGSVQIRGQLAAGGEAVEISSRNLQFDGTRLWTPHEVDFRVGNSFGSGRDLTVMLNNSEFAHSRRADGRLPATMSSQIRSVELVRVERLHIDPSDQWGESLDSEMRQVPIDISCQGSMFVDVISGISRLSQSVRISRRQSDQVFDQLDCEQLDAIFGLKKGPDGLPARETGVVLTRIAAQGEPAKFATRQVVGDPLHQVESPEFAYEFRGEGSFTAAGPGKYELSKTVAAVSDGTAAQGSTDEITTVTWQRQLSWSSTEERSRLELHGRAQCISSQLGRVEADVLGLELVDPNSQGLPRPYASPRAVNRRPSLSSRLRPDQLWGRGDVIIDTPRLLARARDIQVAFVQPPDHKSALPPMHMSEGAPGPNLHPPQQAVDATQGAFGPNDSPGQFQVSGGSMKLEVIAGSKQEVQLTEAVVEGGVRCLEVRGSGSTTGAGVELRGETLALSDFGDRQGTAVIRGSPALIRARQIDVSGPAVHLDRRANRVWVEGAGTATLPLPPALAQRTLNQAPTAYLQWQTRMEFDGQAISCGDNVELRAPTQRIRCTRLSAVLQQPIHLSDTSYPEITVDRVEASGRVTLENRTLGAQGLESMDSAQVEQLTIWQETGKFRGTGPGWLETIRYGSKAALPAALGEQPTAGQAAARQPLDNPPQLIYLKVGFQRALEGNVHKRQVDFVDRVEAVYGPVANWNDRLETGDPSKLPREGLMLRCDRLSVFQIAKRFHTGLPIEITALGNVDIHGAEFRANAYRMSYDQGKGQIVLDGDGRADARLWRQGQGNWLETRAAKVQFWPKANRVNVDGFRKLEWEQK